MSRMASAMLLMKRFSCQEKKDKQKMSAAVDAVIVFAG